MAVPSRMYVGVVVFGLIACLAILAYVILLLTGYPPEGGFGDFLFPDDRSLGAGEILFLALAGLFSLTFLVFAWRRLLAGARQDARKRRRLAELKRQLQDYRRQRGGPPGYN